MQKFQARIEKADQVYDGDTIEHVLVRLLLAAHIPKDVVGEIWPDLIVKDGNLYARFNLRIAGIDAPERHPSTHKRDGTLRSKESREKERKAAMESREALLKLLQSNQGVFTISNICDGKYAGRLVADVHVGDVSVRTYMIENGFANRYDGGTKMPFDFGD